MSQDRLLSDKELRIGIAKALHGKPDPSVLFEYKTYEEFWAYMASSPAVDRLFAFTNTQKRLAVESELAEPKAIIAGLAEELNQATKLGRKYIRISHVEDEIGRKLTEQRARIK